MRSESGTYALLLHCASSSELAIGRWGCLQLVPGHYLYVGSAFGPGGVKARVSRHFRNDKKLRWHIDYLRAEAQPVGAWCSYASEHLEHEWAEALQDMNVTTCIAGFGSSDCHCEGHLFIVPTDDRESLVREITRVIASSEYQYA